MRESFLLHHRFVERLRGFIRQRERGVFVRSREGHEFRGIVVSLPERDPERLHHHVRDILARGPVEIQFLKRPVGVHFEEPDHFPKRVKDRRRVREERRVASLILRVIHPRGEIVGPENDA